MGGSRRIRRGITGVRNTDSVDFCTVSESDVGTPRSRVVSAQHVRPEGLSETIHGDRLIAQKVHQKLYNSLQPRYVRHVLRSADPHRSGKLSWEQLTQSLDRLHIGLNNAEKELVVRRVAADESGRVDMEDFLRSFDEGLQPLGAVAPGQQCYSQGTRRPFEANTGRFKAWDWRRSQSGHEEVQSPRPRPQSERDGRVIEQDGRDRRRPLSERVGRDSGERDRWRPMSQQVPRRDQQTGLAGHGSPAGGTAAGEQPGGELQVSERTTATTMTSCGADGAAAAAGGGGGRSSSHAQQADDVMLMKQLTPKLAHHRERLRLAFRRMDQQSGGSGRIGRDQFFRGVQGLHLAASPAQLQRLTSVVDAADAGGGGVDYERFCNLLEVETVIKPVPPAVVPAGGTLSSTLDIQAYEARQVAAGSRASDLRTLLRARSDRAAKLFKQCDVNDDGRLSLDQLAHCCQELIPGMTQREVACLMVKRGADIADGGDGYQDYREFIRNIVEDEDVSRQRNVRAKPMSPRNANGNTVVWTRPVTPPSSSAPSGGQPGATTTFSSPHRVNAAAAEAFDAGFFAGQAAHEAGVASVLRSLHAAGALPDDALPSETTTSTSFQDAAHQTINISTNDSGWQGGGGGGGKGGTGGTAFGATAVSSSPFLSYEAPPPARRGRGVGRFYHLLQHDTSPAVKAVSGSPGVPVQSNVYMRKDDPAFMTFQQEDLDRKQRHRQQHVQRSEWKADVVNNRVERNSQAAARTDEARLLVKGMAAERALERAELNDLGRRTDAVDERALVMFGRPAFFVSDLRTNTDV